MLNPFKAFENILKEHIIVSALIHSERAWTNPHRYYHNIDHLNDVLISMEKNISFNELNAYERHILLIAAFFHDIVYDPKRTDNEDMSIALYHSISKNNKAFDDEVCRLIEVTKHRKRPFEKLAKIFWDADNAQFYKSFEDYKKNDKNIRKEYSHVSNEQYKEGRIKFLQSNLGLFNSEVDKTINKMIEYLKTAY